MATVKSVKASAMKARASGQKAGKASDFLLALPDNVDDPVTVVVVDKAGVAITDPAVLANVTLTAVSADPTKATVDTIVGLTAVEHLLAPTDPATPVVVSFTATWSDGSFGPFTIDDPLNITTSGPGGLAVNHGPSVVRP
jgi:hypothetical protein